MNLLPQPRFRGAQFAGGIARREVFGREAKSLIAADLQTGQAWDVLKFPGGVANNAGRLNLVTGRVPFVGEDHHEIMRMKEAGHFTPPSLLNPKVPASLQAVLMRMLAASPTLRYQTASDAYIALKRTELAKVPIKGSIGACC